MFSFTQVVCTVGLAAFLIGSKDLPLIAKSVGASLGHLVVFLRRGRNTIHQITRDSQTSELHNELREGLRELNSIRTELRQGVGVSSVRQWMMTTSNPFPASSVPSPAPSSPSPSPTPTFTPTFTPSPMPTFTSSFPPSTVSTPTHPLTPAHTVVPNATADTANVTEQPLHTQPQEQHTFGVTQTQQQTFGVTQTQQHTFGVSQTQQHTFGVSQTQQHTQAKGQRVGVPAVRAEVVLPAAAAAYVQAIAQHRGTKTHTEAMCGGVDHVMESAVYLSYCKQMQLIEQQIAKAVQSSN